MGWKQTSIGRHLAIIYARFRIGSSQRAVIILSTTIQMHKVNERRAKRVVVATHGHCFDGAASAAVFTRFLQSFCAELLEFSYVACGYSPQSRCDPNVLLTGDINAILDYRYTPHPNLHWYFDHHPTASSTDEDRAHFLQHQNHRRFHDTSYGSCAKLVFDIAAQPFGIDLPELAPLVSWADRIDTATFESAEQAIAREHPVLQLMTVLEHAGHSTTLNQLIPRLAANPIEQVASEPAVRRSAKRFLRYHREFVKAVRRNCLSFDTVVLADLSSELHEVAGKFVTYALFPRSVYSVMLTRGRHHTKISVGYNPWSPFPRRHHIGMICTRYGGGGHATVGAIAHPASCVDQAKTVARQIVAELAS